MTNIAELTNLCKKGLRICMLCRLTSKAMLVLCITTKEEWVMETTEEEEEEEYPAKAKDHSLVLDVINRETYHKIVLEIMPHAFFVNLMSML